MRMINHVLFLLGLVSLAVVNANGQCTFTSIAVNEACDPVGDGGFETAVDITFSITNGCTVNEVCYSRLGDGSQGCTDISANLLGDGATYHLALPGAGIYQFWATISGGSSPVEEAQVNCFDETYSCDNPFAVNYEAAGANPNELACLYDDYICDCVGTPHTVGAMSYLGDGEYESSNSGKLWDGQAVHFACNVWGFDCGDGGVNFDPYGVCEGNLPPNNGCSSPGCAPLTLAVTQGACGSDAYGLTTQINVEFGISDGCVADQLCFILNGGDETCIDLSGDGGYMNGETYVFSGAEPGGVYQFHFETTSGAVSPFFYFTCGDPCSGQSTICDCDGNVWPEDHTSYLGDGDLNDGVTPVDGKYLNFNCLTWAFDCGEGNGVEDPFNVCVGNLPPDNGCGNYAFGCTDISACNYDASADGDDGSCDYSCYGCTIPSACNYDPAAALDDGSCEYSCYGCTIPTACNYVASATQDDGSCVFNCQGCTDAAACNYDAGATMDDGSCDYSCLGCIDNTACNYDATATVDDGSCDYSCQGCLDPTACNYDASATVSDGSCDYSCLGCTDPAACNFEVSATDDDGSCTYNCLGCTDSGACNYDSGATDDDGSCDYSCIGCTDFGACNYDAGATQDDGSCDYSCLGCMDPAACNYDATATENDGSCNYDCQGCTDASACNYDITALINDGSCDYSCQGCTDSGACNYDASASQDDGSCDYSCLGCTDPGACNFDASASQDDSSCAYAAPFYNCAGACINDSDGDGICDELEVPGCTYNVACNYNPMATDDDGSCDFDSCLGCTYSGASNFDPGATIDDGSCEYDQPYCVGDVNADGQVNVTDIILLLQYYGTPCD